MEQQCLDANQADGAAEQREEQQAVDSGGETEQAAAGSGMEELCSSCELLRAQLKGDRLSRAAEVQQLQEGLERQHQAELAGAQAQLQAESGRLCQELQRALEELADSREACSQVGWRLCLPAMQTLSGSWPCLLFAAFCMYCIL